MKRTMAISVLLLVAGIAPAAGATSPDRTPPGGGSSASASRDPFESPSITRLTFDTSEGRFDPGVNNQGWYRDTGRNSNRNSNYIVGHCCGGGSEYRDFFTFDLSSLTRHVETATLVLFDPFNRGDVTETIRFSDVTTPAKRLNANGRVHPDIFADLGSGRSFGTFSPIRKPNSQVRRFRLNHAAVAAINRAAGSYFSLGGQLLSLDYLGEEFLFGGSGNGRQQELIVRTSG
jgi:hypothetical protein